MDRLTQIDSILKKAAADVPANASSYAADWDAIERRLKFRRNRIRAMWFLLALLSSSIITIYLNLTNEPSLPSVEQNKPQENSISKTTVADHSALEKGENLNDKMEDNDQSVYKEPVKKNSILQTLTIKNPYSHNISWKDQEIAALPKSSIDLYTYQRFEDISAKKLDYLSFNQPTTHKNIPTGKAWEYGISFTPGVSGKRVSENEALAGLINKNFDSFIGNQESTAFASSFGVNISYHLNDKFFISSGIYRSQRAESVNYQYTITEYPIVTNGKITDYVPLNPLAHEDVNYRGSNLYHFMEIPLQLGMKQAISRNFEIRAQLGMSFLSLTNQMGQKGNFLSLQLEDIATLKFNNQNIATSIKTGLYYTKPKFNIGIEPSYSMNLNSLNTKTAHAFITRPYAYGINIITNIRLGQK